MVQNHRRAVLFYNSSAFQISLWSLGWQSPDILHSVWKEMSRDSSADEVWFWHPKCPQCNVRCIWISRHLQPRVMGQQQPLQSWLTCFLLELEAEIFRFFSSLPARLMGLSQHGEALELLKSRMLAKRHLLIILLQW